MVEKSLEHPNMVNKEYSESIGIAEDVKDATRKYAESSAATELRLLSSEGVMVNNMSQ